MVRCYDCGLLATRNYATGQWEEVDQRQRDTGSGQIREYEGIPREVPSQFSRPACIFQVFNLASEYTQESSKSDSKIESAIVSVLRREGNCESFAKWQLGFSPKEHREMMDRKWMQEMEDKRRSDDKKWHRIELSIVVVGNLLAIVIGVILGHFLK